LTKGPWALPEFFGLSALPSAQTKLQSDPKGFENVSHFEVVGHFENVSQVVGHFEVVMVTQIPRNHNILSSQKRRSIDFRVERIMK